MARASNSAKRTKRKLSAIFGMNRRNRDLVAAYNPPKLVSLANDKAACKIELEKHGVQTPREIATIRFPAGLDAIFPALEQEEGGFVVKPSRGAQGRSVRLFSGAKGDRVFQLHGPPISRRDLQFLVSSIISGEFTAGRPVDCALVEERLRPSTSWIMKDLPGAPDLRVIVYKGEPVMAMARLPTIDSGGRANLHRGALGLGVDFESCETTHAVWKDRPVSRHPDTGIELRGLKVDRLEECLELSRRCAKAVPLGYMGVDLMLDAKKGPCVIELNGRPGLAIQIANRRGLGEVIPGRV